MITCKLISQWQREHYTLSEKKLKKWVNNLIIKQQQQHNFKLTFKCEYENKIKFWFLNKKLKVNKR